MGALGGGAAVGAWAFAQASTPAHAQPPGPPFVKQSAMPVNVADYGAHGDGKADDTAAIQKAIDTAAATVSTFVGGRSDRGGTGGGVVFFPAGTYATSAPLTVTTHNIVLMGEGVGSRIVRKNDTDTHTLISFIGPKGRGAAAPSILNCGLKLLAVGNSDKGAPESAPAVSMNKCVQWSIQQCNIEQPGGIGLQTTDCFIGNLVANDIRLNTQGVVFNGVANALNISGNRIQANSGVAMQFPSWSSSTNGYAGQAMGVHITGNDIEGNGAEAILFGDGNVRNISIVGNYMELNWESSFTDQDGPYIHKPISKTPPSTNPPRYVFRGLSVICNNIMYGTKDDTKAPSKYAIVIEEGTDITLLGNHFATRIGSAPWNDDALDSYRFGSGVSETFVGPLNSFGLEVDHDLSVTQPGEGLALTSPNGTRFHLSISDDGQWVSERM